MAAGEARVAERVYGRQWGVLALVLAALAIDGIDIQLLAQVSPLIMKEWGVDKSAFGPAMSAALIGMALGAGAGGWIGDRVGRRTVHIAALLLFGACTAGVAFAQDLTTLVVLRLVAGLGFGALAPNGAALASEWLPVRARPMAMAMLSITIPLGGLIGGSAVLALLPLVGWQGCFVACGLLTVAVAVLMVFALPESPAYLAARGRREEAARLLRVVAGGGAAPEARPENAGKAWVFTRGNLRLNAGAWFAFFWLQLIAYGFISWTPTLLTMTGWPLASAIQATLVFNLAAVCTSLATGWLLGRMRFGTLALIGALGSVVAVALLYLLVAGAPGTGNQVAVLATIAVVSVFAGTGIASVYTFLSFAYPAACRGSGIGIGLMSARAGGIAIAFSGGLLLALDGESLLPFFLVLGSAGVLAAVGLLVLEPRYRGRLRDLADAG